MGTLLILFICIGLPLAIILWLQRRQHIWLSFFIGMLVFVISQIVLRIPMLQLLQQDISFQLFTLQTIPYAIFLGLTAGLFEEIGRYIGLRCLKRHHTFYEVIAFGLGHGAIEAILLTAIPLLSYGDLPLQDVWIAGWERITAMCAHIAFTLLVWKSVQNKKLIYLMLAIFVHAIFDFMAVMMMQANISIILIESILMIVSIVLLIIVYYATKKERENV